VFQKLKTNAILKGPNDADLKDKGSKKIFWKIRNPDEF